MVIPDDPVLNLLESWYTLEMPRLFRYVSYRVRDRAAAEELTAAICEQALRDLTHYNPLRGDFNGWMFGIARNLVKMHYRKQGRQPESISLENLPDVRAPGTSIEQSYDLIESFRFAVSHLHQLSEQEQDVIGLRYGADLSNQEIAEVMELTTNHVNVLLHRGLKRLRALITAAEKI